LVHVTNFDYNQNLLNTMPGTPADRAERASVLSPWPISVLHRA
jgi:hypothetical protein